MIQARSIPAANPTAAPRKLPPSLSCQYIAPAVATSKGIQKTATDAAAIFQPEKGSRSSGQSSFPSGHAPQSPQPGRGGVSGARGKGSDFFSLNISFILGFFPNLTRGSATRGVLQRKTSKIRLAFFSKTRYCFTILLEVRKFYATKNAY